MTGPKRTKVLIVDDHPIIISGCKSLFTSHDAVEFESAANAEDGYKAFVETSPDITLIDVSLPDVSGFELMWQIHREAPAAPIIMLSMNDDSASAVRALENGALGYLSKSDDPACFVDAVLKVAVGQRYVPPYLADVVAFSAALQRSLTVREVEILTLLRRGAKLVEIAHKLDISYKTVANTTSLLKQKLSAKSHADLIRIAIDMAIE